jgi:hypothetical protein
VKRSWPDAFIAVHAGQQKGALVGDCCRRAPSGGKLWARGRHGPGTVEAATRQSARLNAAGAAASTPCQPCSRVKAALCRASPASCPGGPYHLHFCRGGDGLHLGSLELGGAEESPIMLTTVKIPSQLNGEKRPGRRALVMRPAAEVALRALCFSASEDRNMRLNSHRTGSIIDGLACLLVVGPRITPAIHFNAVLLFS